MNLYLKDAQDLVNKLMSDCLTSSNECIKTDGATTYFIRIRNVPVFDIVVNKNGTGYLIDNDGGRKDPEKLLELSELIAPYVVPEKHKANN